MDDYFIPVNITNVEKIIKIYTFQLNLSFAPLLQLLFAQIRILAAVWYIKIRIDVKYYDH